MSFRQIVPSTGEWDVDKTPTVGTAGRESTAPISFLGANEKNIARRVVATTPTAGDKIFAPVNMLSGLFYQADKRDRLGVFSSLVATDPGAPEQQFWKASLYVSGAPPDVADACRAHIRAAHPDDMRPFPPTVADFLQLPRDAIQSIFRWCVALASGRDTARVHTIVFRDGGEMRATVVPQTWRDYIHGVKRVVFERHAHICVSAQIIVECNITNG